MSPVDLTSSVFDHYQDTDDRADDRLQIDLGRDTCRLHDLSLLREGVENGATSRPTRSLL